MNIQAVIFDLDGVITDTAEHHFESWSYIARKLNFTLTQDHNDQLKGVSRSRSIDKIINWAAASVTPSWRQKLLEEKNEIYLERIHQLTSNDILPGVVHFLASLSNNKVRTAIGSSSRNARLILEKLNLLESFEVISDGNSVIRTKPYPDVFEHAASELGIRPEYCVVIEDAPSGVEAAISAGMKVVGIGNEIALNQATICLPNMNDLTFESFKKMLA